ncbi:hypothetical protein HY745_14450 [Candidatus Desantisbacteria bacterium]|nr:hypothetical protein [Candidatus Desantisbacteria bacterium]
MDKIKSDNPNIGHKKIKSTIGMAIIIIKKSSGLTLVAYLSAKAATNTTSIV